MKNLLSNLSFVDVETTGTSATGDRIIDIGIVRVEEGKIVEEFESLVNPLTHLSPFISQMTSITPEMLYRAPTFEEIKSKVYDMLDGTTFVAHNAQFDYAFIKQEFARLETKFSSKMLCTVRLSRLLFPEYKHHNLDALVERFNLPMEKRHRAFPDAKALYFFLDKVRQVFPEDKLSMTVKSLVKKSRIPTAIDFKLIKNLPNQPGVYIFYDAEGTVLYVGKSTHLKDRVMSHFSAFHSISTDLKLATQAADLEIIRTGGDLSACLLEAELIKKMQPIFNRQLREARECVALIKKEDTNYHTIELKRIRLPITGDSGRIVSLYPSMKKAKETIHEILKEKHICPIVSGLEKGPGPCFNFQIGKCDGACTGKESALKHNLKLIEALGNYFIPKWPFDGEIAIREESEDVSELIHINNWMHVGTTLVSQGDAVFKKKENVIYTDTVKILKKFLKRRDYLKKIAKALPADLQSTAIY